MFMSKSYPRKNLLSTNYAKATVLFQKFSNEPLQKSNVNIQEERLNQPQTQKSGEFATPSDTLQTGKNMSQEIPKPSISTSASDLSLIQKKLPSDILLNADPFEEVPGPELLKKASSVWRYLPEIGCQATVSAMLSFFNISQKISKLTNLGKREARPFDKLFQKYGPIVKLQGPLGADIVLINKPEHVAKVYDQEGKYPIRSTLDSVEKCRSQSRKSCGGPFNLSGTEWEDLRKALQEPLARGGERYFDSIQDASEMFIKRVRAVKNKQNEITTDFMVEVTRWSMECLCFVALGKSLGFHSDMSSSSEPIRLLKALIEATENACKCESGFQLWRFMSTPSSIALTQACEVIDGFISKHIRLAQVNLSRHKDEFLNKEKPEEGLTFIENLLLNECLSPEEVLTCIVDLLLMGVNTTSSALAFTLYHLAQNQRAQRMLFKEVNQFLPEKDTRLMFKQLSEMIYLDACLNESLRLKMPMPTLTRVLPTDIALSNFRIPKGTYVVMDIQTACLKEQNFEKNEKFIPERWFEPSSIQPFAFIPFGHGRRSCLGKQLAEVQLKCCIAKIVRNFQIEYNYGELQGTKTVISFPEQPLKLSFIEREA